jgi:exopolysaccharide production protein ExoZ
MFFYAVFALALLLRVNLFWFVGVVLGACTALSFMRTTLQPWTMFLDPIVLQFFFGMLVAASLWRMPHVARTMTRVPFVPLALAVAGFALLVLLPFQIAFVPDALKTGVPATMVILGVLWLEPHLRGRLPRWLLLLGDASYSLYLFHPLIMPIVPVALRKFGIENVAVSIVLCVIIGLAAGVLIHLLIERPLTRLLKGWVGGSRISKATDTIAANRP